MSSSNFPGMCVEGRVYGNNFCHVGFGDEIEVVELCVKYLYWLKSIILIITALECFCKETLSVIELRGSKINFPY